MMIDRLVIIYILSKSLYYRLFAFCHPKFTQKVRKTRQNILEPSDGSFCLNAFGKDVLKQLDDFIKYDILVLQAND